MNPSTICVALGLLAILQAGPFAHEAQAMGTGKPKQPKDSQIGLIQKREYRQNGVLVRREVLLKNGDLQVTEFGPGGEITRSWIQPKGAPATYVSADMQEKLELLRAHNPDGARIYDMSHDHYPFQFHYETGWNFVVGLETAVHEAAHAVDQKRFRMETYSYYLLDGSWIEAPRYGTFAWSAVMLEMDETGRQEHYAQTYLTGQSGAQGLHILLEELNAYAHGVTTTLDLAEGLGRAREDYANPGLQRMMKFLQLYLRHARNHQPEVWSRLKASNVWKNAIQRLWRQAESVLQRACLSPNAQAETHSIAPLFEANQASALLELLGPGFSLNPPICNS